MSEPSALLDAAIIYAAAGKFVFPLCPRGKEPLTEHGFKDATTNGDRIREWWSRWPDANIGAPTGANGWTVLDIDTDSPELAFEIATRLGLGDTSAPLVRTGKGRQLYFRAVEGLGPSVRAVELVDVRSGESYVILPPSVHPNGREYRWNVPLSETLPAIPDETLRILRSGRAKKARATASLDGSKIPEGQRNAELARIAGGLRRWGCDEDTIRHHLLKTNAARCDPPLSETEVESVAGSIARYEPAEGRPILAEAHYITGTPSPTYIGEIPDLDLGKAISILKTVLDHPDPFFHASLILGAAQDHVVDLLHTVFYIIFSGGPDTGKGTANACAMALTRNGIVLGGATGPYLRDTLGGGRAVAISEFETLLKENSQLLAVVRNGNRRVTSTVGLKIAAGNKWTNANVDTFGFKTMDYHDRLDAHVLGRALQFEMVRSKELDVAMDAEYLVERLAPVRIWLASRAKTARDGGWNVRRVRQIWDSREFRGRVRKFKNAWGRHGVIAAYLLLIDDIFGFGLEDTIRELMDAREPELSPLAQDVQEAIDDFAGEAMRPDLEIRVNDVLKRVNENRAPIRPATSISGALRELGFSTKTGSWIPAKNNRSGENRGKAVILPYEVVLSWRSVQETPARSSPEDRTGFASQLEAIQAIREAARRNGGGFRLEDLPEPERTAFEAFRKPWLDDGTIYSPTQGSYRFTEDSP